MSGFHSYSQDRGGEHPFSVHTASDTLLGRSDLHIPEFASPSGRHERDFTANSAASNAGNLDTDYYSPGARGDGRDVGQNEENWVSSPRRREGPAYRDTKTSATRTRLGQAMIPEGGNQRVCGHECRNKGRHTCGRSDPQETADTTSQDAIRLTDDRDTYATDEGMSMLGNPLSGGDGGNTVYTADNTAGSDDALDMMMSPGGRERKLHSLWTAMSSSLAGIAARGFDRTLIYSVQPFVERRVLDASLGLVESRLEKRVSDAWQASEPSEVVVLCGEFLKSYKEVQNMMK